MPFLIKGVLLGVAACAGVNRALRRSLCGRLTVLCYHSVSPRDGEDAGRNSVGEREFERQMEWLARCYAPVSAGDVRAWIEQGRALPKSPALVTFDDGYRNNLLAARILERRGIPAVFFVCTGYIGAGRMLWTDEIRLRIARWPKPLLPMPAGQSDWPLAKGCRAAIADSVAQTCKRLPCPAAAAYLERLRQTAIPGWAPDDAAFGFLSWDEVRSLCRRGFEIGSHTVEHPVLTCASAAHLDSELRQSKAAIEKETGAECCSVAYPNGAFDSQVIAAARAAGYKLGFTVSGRASSREEDPRALGRFHIPGRTTPGLFESHLSGFLAMAERVVRRGAGAGNR